MKKTTSLLSAILLMFFLFGCQKDDTAGPSGSSDELLNSGLTSGSSFDSSSGSSGSSSSGSSSSGSGSTPAGQMTAGEWNDLDNWDFWNGLLANDTIAGYQDYWNFHPTQRYTVKVVDNLGKPVSDSQVRLMANSNDPIWEARTDNFGKAELWANLYSGNDQVTQLFVESTVVSNPNPVGVNEVVLTGGLPQYSSVDVAFVVDATGSMGDEIEYLKVELTDVLNRIQNAGAGLNLRAASVFYRDEGDEYVTKVSPFSTNFNLTQSFVNNNHAGGGGDFPEAVDQAMDKAINNLEWSDHARTRIAFLILDAPPHHEDQAIATLQRSIEAAAQKGVKVIPIVASGIDKETEFLMRYCAMATNGTYVFITDDSGIGNPHLQATVGDYEVEFLNDLMVRLVKKYSQQQ
ncbi:MAG: VWA domain-containing protein [Saprospiraceae bacterium]|nr:VWA domain-containing protein [Saprospiraceae bacterium]MCF8249569.1 VWA domain-containing protein [Saprospiraceae bacterium]MCF8280469.1 VWA domain-containing protein [Bacteroidales bacterium]MCF8310401.1 VWA domain-containing protein [Saprospiraceae bacterium]MCF8439779.1 VWA domain-containing protein [Saprospiraceae bacterium]